MSAAPQYKAVIFKSMCLESHRGRCNSLFAARLDVSFGDLDVVGIGPVIADVSEMFYVYWNGRAAVTGSGPAQI